MNTDTQQRLADDMIYGLEAIGNHMGLKKGQVHYLIRKGNFPAIRIGPHWAIRRSSLVKWIEKLENATIAA